MLRLPTARVRALFLKADKAKTRQVRGALLEEAMRIFFPAIPGVELGGQNVLNAADTEEVDILFWNQRLPRGLYHLETPFLVECKNWGKKVNGQAIQYFANTLKGRGCRDGILIASKGITGDPGTLTEAHYEIAVALREGKRILVVTRSELESLHTVRQLSLLLKDKIMDLALRGTKIS
jgi:hypothetical protein